MPARRRTKLPRQDDVVLKRYEKVRAKLVEGRKVLDVCRSFRVTSPTLYAWIHRFRDGGMLALADRSHAPLHPNRIPEGVEEAIVALRREDSWRSSYEIVEVLKEKGVTVGSATVQRVLKRRGLPRVRPAPKKTRARRGSPSSRRRGRTRKGRRRGRGRRGASTTSWPS